MSHKRNIPRTCEQCGALFFTFAEAVKKGKCRFCSEPCRRIGGNYGKRPTPLIERFWSRVDKTDTCWLWTGQVSKAGYGTIGSGGRNGHPLLIHRLSWQLHYGPIPDDMFVCHRCDNPPCCNPEHLFLGTNQQNVDDKVNKGRQCRGETQPNARLTEDQVREIRTRHANGERMSHLARAFNMHHHSIWLIVHRVNWKHI